MSYALGAVHGPVSGAGSLAVAAPHGLLLQTDDIPSSVGAQFGDPMFYRGLGAVTPATADGWLPQVAIHFEEQLLLELPDDVVSIAYDLVAGAQLVVTELVAVSPVIAPELLAPWDRNGTPAGGQGLMGLPANTATGSFLTYTVPSGRRLWLTDLGLRIYRLEGQPASGLTTPSCWWQIASTTRLMVRLSRLMIDSQDRLAGPLVLAAGTTITAYGVNAETAGYIYTDAHWSGILFDA